jgi:hypothetical protein
MFCFDVTFCLLVTCLQDWFGTDLKIRRIGQYWTMLEYVLEVRKKQQQFGKAAVIAATSLESK